MMDGDGGFDGSYGRRSTRRERKLSLPQSDIDVDLMLEAYPVSPGGRDELDAALIDIYIKAARRLVVTADILPNELRRRSSEIRDYSNHCLSCMKSDSKLRVRRF